ncbi:MAG: V-type ATP synthase subunit E [Candidatus Helarchaeota archaeon]
MEDEDFSLAERIDSLMKEVIDDAEVKAESFIKEAEEQAFEKIHRATLQFEKEIDRMFEEFYQQIQKDREVKLSEVRTQITHEIIIEKEKKIEEILGTVQKLLSEFVNNPLYKTFLSKAFEKCLTFLPAGNYTLLLNKSDHPSFPQEIINKVNQRQEVKITLAQDEFSDRHGVIIKSEDGRILVEDTLEERFERKKEKLRSQIAKLLFSK